MSLTRRSIVYKHFFLAAQRKASTVHETHNQFNNLPKYSPQELSRMKAEKDLRDGADVALARKRQEEQIRQTLLREQAQQAQRNNALPVSLGPLCLSHF